MLCSSSLEHTNNSLPRERELKLNEQRPTPYSRHHFPRTSDHSNVWEVVAIGKMFEQKSPCTKQNRHYIRAEFHRKTPLFEFGPEERSLWYSHLALHDRRRRRA